MVILLLGLLGCLGEPCGEGTVRGGDGCVPVFVGQPVPHDDVPRPVPGGSWQIQLTGPVDTTVDAALVDVDLFALDDAAAAALGERQLACWFSAGTWEASRPDADAFPRDALGRAVQGWDGERWVDVMDAEVRGALVGRLDLAVRKGCDVVDADHVDGWTRSTGFPITWDEQLDFVRFLADAAHDRGLGFALRNDPAQVEPLLPWIDLAVVEDCDTTDTCGWWEPVVDADLAVLSILYAEDGEPLADAAARRCGGQPPAFDRLVKPPDVGPDREACVSPRPLGGEP